MAVHDQNGARITNLRTPSQMKDMLREIQVYWAKKGKDRSLNQLCAEAVFEYYKPELAKARKELDKEKKAARAA